MHSVADPTDGLDAAAPPGPPPPWTAASHVSPQLPGAPAHAGGNADEAHGQPGELQTEVAELSAILLQVTERVSQLRHSRQEP